MVESQSSKLMTRVQFPSSALRLGANLISPQFFQAGFPGFSFFSQEVKDYGYCHHG